MSDDSAPVDSIEVVFEPGKVGLVANHGPIAVTIAFSPEQAETIAATMLGAASAARKAAAATVTQKGKPS